MIGSIGLCWTRYAYHYYLSAQAAAKAAQARSKQEFLADVAERKAEEARILAKLAAEAEG